MKPRVRLVPIPLKNSGVWGAGLIPLSHEAFSRSTAAVRYDLIRPLLRAVAL
jgi:hypothetical protein